MEQGSNFKDAQSDNNERNDIKVSVSALKKRNMELERELHNLELVFRNAVDILFIVDTDTLTIRKASDAVEALLGYKRSDLIGRKLTDLLFLEKTDTDSHSEDITPEIADGILLDQQLLCSDSSVKIMDMTTSLLNSNGASFILLTLRDTSERKLRMREMIKKNSALDNSLSAIIITDNSWRIDYANLETLNYWRYSRSDILRLELADLFSFPGDFDNFKSAVIETGQWDGEIECQRRDSTTFITHATVISVDDENEMDSGYILSFLDITRRIDLEKKLTELSLRDNLTGLYNRRGFMTLGRQLLDSSRRKQPEIGLLYVDIDYLKLINDKLGHSAGNRAIEATASILRNCFRDSDIIARLGGDEFVVLFLDTTEFIEKSIRERINSQLKEILTTDSLPFVLSLSVGYYTTVLCYQTQIAKLLSLADSLMYEDKKERKSRITEEEILLGKGK